MTNVCSSSALSGSSLTSELGLSASQLLGTSPKNGFTLSIWTVIVLAPLHRWSCTVTGDGVPTMSKGPVYLIDRRPSLTSVGGTRAALSWSICCTRHNSGTERGTSRKSRCHRTWEVSEYASASRARGYCSQTRRRTTCWLAVKAAIFYSIENGPMRICIPISVLSLGESRAEMRFKVSIDFNGGPRVHISLLAKTVSILLSCPKN